MAKTTRTGLTPKGKSPLDKKKPTQYNGASHNSVERKILTGEFTLPGLNRQQTIKKYREYQKDFRINSQSMEKWYNKSVRDMNPRAETS